MAHFPVNHPARPLYRLFSGLVGLYILVFGIFGVVETWGETLFARDGHFVLGLRTNLAFALVSVVFGAFLLLGASRRRGNLGHYMNLTAGVVFLVTALAMMTVLQTDANILNFSMSTVIVSMIFGLLLLATGLYDKVGPPEHAHAEERYRREPVPTRET
jgi:glucose uptake protein GlcU